MAMALPTRMRAVKIVSQGLAEVQSVPLPTLQPHTVLVKVSHVALNPTDVSHLDNLLAGPEPGRTLGCDFSGTVVGIGPQGTRGIPIGARVAGVVHGSASYDFESGAFAEFVVAPENMLIKLPDSITLSEAATLGVAVGTCGIALYHLLGLPVPQLPSSGSAGADHEKPGSLLIYGAASGMGLFACQLARASGVPHIIATASPANFDRVKAAGAHAVLDYNSPAVAADIRCLTENRCRLALDCIGIDTSGSICAAALTSMPGARYVGLKHGSQIHLGRSDLSLATSVLGYQLVGRSFDMRGMHLPANPEVHQFGRFWFEYSERLLAEGVVKGIPLQEGGKGLDKVIEGLDDMRHGRVRGSKRVHAI